MNRRKSLDPLSINIPKLSFDVDKIRAARERKKRSKSEVVVRKRSSSVATPDEESLKVLRHAFKVNEVVSGKKDYRLASILRPQAEEDRIRTNTLHTTGLRSKTPLM
jgi:hypothetical protein